MPVDPSNVNLEALKPWAGHLACPACLATLRVESSSLVCPGCGRVYPIENQIPVLIVERGIQPK